MSRTTLLGLSVAALLTAGGWKLWAPAMKGVEAAPAFRTAEAKRGPLRQTVREVGHVQPSVRTDVKSEVSGRVAEVLAKTGDTVKAGQVLVRLDDRIPLKQLEQARIKVEQARLTETKQKRNFDRRAQRRSLRDKRVMPELAAWATATQPSLRTGCEGDTLARPSTKGCPAQRPFV